MHFAAILIDYILWQRIHSFPSSSSSSTPPISISQFGFVPLLSGQPDLQSRTGSWVWGSAEKTAHEGQVLSGLPHECHGPGAGKGSCGQKTWRKRTKFTPHPRGEYNIFIPVPPCDRLSPACCILSKKAKRLKGNSTKLNISQERWTLNLDYLNHTESANQKIFVLNFKSTLLRCCLCMQTPFLPCDPLVQVLLTLAHNQL